MMSHKRYLYTAYGRHDRGATLVLVTNHLANDFLSIERIHTDDAIFHPFVDQGLNNFLLPL